VCVEGGGGLTAAGAVTRVAAAVIGRLDAGARHLSVSTVGGGRVVAPGGADAPRRAGERVHGVADRGVGQRGPRRRASPPATGRGTGTDLETAAGSGQLAERGGRPSSARWRATAAGRGGGAPPQRPSGDAGRRSTETPTAAALGASTDGARIQCHFQHVTLLCIEIPM